MPDGKALTYSVADIAIPTAVAAYLDEVVSEFGTDGGPLVSLVLFGSTTTGGYAAPVSDVDLLLVLGDHANAALRHCVRDQVAAIEARQGECRAQPPLPPPPRPPLHAAAPLVARAACCAPCLMPQFCVAC